MKKISKAPIVAPITVAVPPISGPNKKPPRMVTNKTNRQRKGGHGCIGQRKTQNRQQKMIGDDAGDHFAMDGQLVKAEITVPAHNIDKDPKAKDDKKRRKAHERRFLRFGFSSSLFVHVCLILVRMVAAAFAVLTDVRVLVYEWQS